MRRRDFIALLGGAAAWPLAARAQQPERMRRLGVMTDTAETNPEGRARIAALRQRLHELGWTQGRNLEVDYRWSAGDVERARGYAAEIVALNPDVIFALANAQLAPLSRETHNSNRFRRSLGPGRTRLRRKFCAPRRQYHWIYPL
jgi:putative ABC transport system substrate-binding protein